MQSEPGTGKLGHASNMLRSSWGGAKARDADGAQAGPSCQAASLSAAGEEGSHGQAPLWQLGKRRQKRMRELAKQDVTRTGLPGAAGEELSLFTRGEPAAGWTGSQGRLPCCLPFQVSLVVVVGGPVPLQS